MSFDWLPIATAHGSAESVAAKYPTGSTVQVYFNPRKPSVAVLEHVPKEKIWLNTLVFIVMTALCLILLVMVLTGNSGNGVG